MREVLSSMDICFFVGMVLNAFSHPERIRSVNLSSILKWYKKPSYSSRFYCGNTLLWVGGVCGKGMAAYSGPSHFSMRLSCLPTQILLKSSERPGRARPGRVRPGHSRPGHSRPGPLDGFGLLFHRTQVVSIFTFSISAFAIMVSVFKLNSCGF